MPDDAPVTTATDSADGGGSAMRLTLVQADVPIELNRRSPRDFRRALARCAVRAYGVRRPQPQCSVGTAGGDARTVGLNATLYTSGYVECAYGGFGAGAASGMSSSLT